MHTDGVEFNRARDISTTARCLRRPSVVLRWRPA